MQTLLNFRRDPVSEGLRLERLLEAQLTPVNGSLEPFAFHPRDRRTETRVRVDTQCAVCVIIAQNNEPIRGVVRDVSRSGLGLVLPSPVSEGAEVMVRFGSVVVFGHVAFVLWETVDEKRVFYAGITLRHVFEIRENEASDAADSLVREL